MTASDMDALIHQVELAIHYSFLFGAVVGAGAMYAALMLGAQVVAFVRVRRARG